MLLTNCGGFKIKTDLDDSIKKIADSVEQKVDSEDDSKSSNGKSKGNSNKGNESEIDDSNTDEDSFIGTYSKFADTCNDYNLKSNVRVYETDDYVTLKSNNETYLTLEYYEDDSLDLTIPGNFGDDDLYCVCEVKSDDSIQCSCENDETDCGVIWGTN